MLEGSRFAFQCFSRQRRLEAMQGTDEGGDEPTCRQVMIGTRARVVGRPDRPKRVTEPR